MKVEKNKKDYEELKKFLSDASLDDLFECQNDYGYENQIEKQEDIDGKEENIMKTELEEKSNIRLRRPAAGSSAERDPRQFSPTTAAPPRPWRLPRRT